MNASTRNPLYENEEYRPMSETIIDRARGHLGSAIAQSIPADDQIIMDHVKAAYELLGAIGMHIHRAGSSADRPADECALCGHDLRHAIHERVRQ